MKKKRRKTKQLQCGHFVSTLSAARAAAGRAWSEAEKAAKVRVGPCKECDVASLMHKNILTFR